MNYYGKIDGEGEIDRMRAWLFPGQEVTVELAAVGGDVDARVEDSVKSVLLPKLEAHPEQVVTAPIVGSTAENLIRVQGQPGARWRLRLSPADAAPPAERTASWSCATPVRASSASRSRSTRSDGTFTLRRRTRTGGTVYAAVVERVSGRRLCRFARSPRVRA